jgi:hypothetical protein
MIACDVRLQIDRTPLPAGLDCRGIGHLLTSTDHAAESVGHLRAMRRSNAVFARPEIPSRRKKKSGKLRRGYRSMIARLGTRAE